MKTRLLALLLCLLLAASAFLMTACGTKKTSEVTDEQEREVALSSFMKGIEAIRKGGIVFTGSLKGSSTEKNRETGALETENYDLTLTLNYNNDKFDAVANGTAGKDSGKFEIYFDGTLVGMLTLDENEVADGEVHFLDDAAAELPFPVATDDGVSALLDQVLALIDLDKVAANISGATKDVISIKTNGKTYTVTVSSDAFFDLALAKLAILKDSGDKTVAELIDALCGEGTSAKLSAELGAIQGTDKLVTLLPKVEAALSDLGLNVNATYDFVAKIMMGADATGEQLKTFIANVLGEMTLDEGIEFVFNKISEIIGSIFQSIFQSISDSISGNGEEEIGEGEVEPMNSAGPEAAGETGATGATEETGEESNAPTWAYIYGMIEGFLSGNVNDSFGTLFGTEKDETTGEPIPFDIAKEAEAAIETVTALKGAIKFSVTVTCDKKLNPTSIELTASVDTTDLPEDMIDEGEVTKIDLQISAKIKSSVEVAPSTAMQAQIAAAQSARDAASEEEEEN